ncbi:G2/M phase-specific E3 ubiquitin-protein ligase [Merluccius polli]|uniref:G2/M phase-specific E3 ubiquitin-protein ligase n=1 Tax=Merluccius polli TaxID=89951 RepID=A0AA47MVY5_MERPO|nr:G2/M phase-specific E3 ubiquitin-protein ligase [Merluccius polli]
MSSGDKVIWCFATQDIAHDAPSIPADTLIMSTSAGVITIDETLTMSSGTPAISTVNTHGFKYLDLFEEEYLSDDPDLQEAISRSLDSSASESDLQMTLERIMEQISSRKKCVGVEGIPEPWADPIFHPREDKIGIFEGPPDAHFEGPPESLTCNSKVMKDNGYFNAGQIMAMSIAHGGQSPCFLSELLYECLQKGSGQCKGQN